MLWGGTENSYQARDYLWRHRPTLPWCIDTRMRSDLKTTSPLWSELERNVGANKVSISYDLHKMMLNHYLINELGFGLSPAICFLSATIVHYGPGPNSHLNCNTQSGRRVTDKKCPSYPQTAPLSSSNDCIAYLEMLNCARAVHKPVIHQDNDHEIMGPWHENSTQLEMDQPMISLAYCFENPLFTASHNTCQKSYTLQWHWSCTQWRQSQYTVFPDKGYYCNWHCVFNLRWRNEKCSVRKRQINQQLFSTLKILKHTCERLDNYWGTSRAMAEIVRGDTAHLCLEIVTLSKRVAWQELSFALYKWTFSGASFSNCSSFIRVVVFEQSWLYARLPLYSHKRLT